MDMILPPMKICLSLFVFAELFLLAGCGKQEDNGKVASVSWPARKSYMTKVNINRRAQTLRPQSKLIPK